MTDTPDFLWCDDCWCFHNDPHGEGPFVCGDSPEECAEQYREELAKAPEPEFRSDWSTAGLNGLLGDGGPWSEPVMSGGWIKPVQPAEWYPTHVGDVRMFTDAGVNMTRKQVVLDITGDRDNALGSRSTLAVRRVTKRQRRLCQRTGHPHRVMASWWEGTEMPWSFRWYRRITVCSRCGTEVERDHNTVAP